MFIYKPEEDRWLEGPAIPEGRRRGGAPGCAPHCDGWIYVVGGIVDGHHAGPQAWFDRIHPETGEWQVLSDAPNKREHAPCAIVRDKRCFFGARETGWHSGRDYNQLFFDKVEDVDVFDFAAGTWPAHAEPLPIQPAAGGTGVLGEKIHYVDGAAGRMEAFTEMQVFEPDAGTWTMGARGGEPERPRSKSSQLNRSLMQVNAAPAADL